MLSHGESNSIKDKVVISFWNVVTHNCQPPILASLSTSHISCTPSLKNTTLYSTKPLRISYTLVGNKASKASCGVIRW